MNLLTEDNLPYYHLALWGSFGKEGAWGEWVRRWTAEEGRHAIVLRDYLTVTRGLDPVLMERGRMDQVSRGYYPENGGAFADPLDGVVYTTLQELATRIAHRNTGKYTDDPLIEKLTARIAVDENLHYVFYRELGAAALEIDPSSMVQAIKRQVFGFAMPGIDLPEFRAKALEMAKAGIYDLRIHRDQVVIPVLFTHWKIDQLDGPHRRGRAGEGRDLAVPRTLGRDGEEVRGQAGRERSLTTPPDGCDTDRPEGSARMPIERSTRAPSLARIGATVRRLLDASNLCAIATTLVPGGRVHQHGVFRVESEVGF